MPTTLSPVMNGMLRKDLHFDGLIVTDAMSMSGLTIYFTAEEASVRAIEAGADLLLKPADADADFRGVHEAVKKGRLTEQRLDESVRKVWRPNTIWDWSSNGSLRLMELIAQSAETITELADDIAGDAITLVRNDASCCRSTFSRRRVFSIRRSQTATIACLLLSRSSGR